MTRLIKNQSVYVCLTLFAVTILQAGDSGRKRRSQFTSSTASLSKKLGSSLGGSRKRAFYLFDDGTRVGFKRKGNFNYPFMRLSDYTKKGNNKNSIYEGSEPCDRSGSMSIKNFRFEELKDKKSKKENIELFAMDGEVSFNQCTDYATEYFDEDGVPDRFKESIHTKGFIEISGTEAYSRQETTEKSGANMEMEYNYTETRIKANKKSGLVFNGDSIESMDLAIESELTEGSGIEKDGDGGFYFTTYLDGKVSVKGKINGEGVKEERVFKEETFVYHFIDCDINGNIDDCKMKTYTEEDFEEEKKSKKDGGFLFW